VVESAGVVVETDETSNTFVIPVTVAQPDLVPTGLVAPPTVIAPSTFQVSWSAQNPSAATIANQIRDSLYLSTDTVVGGGDVALFTNVLVANGLGAGASYNINNFGVNMPAVTAGSYYLILVVDAAGATSESNETNNTLAIPITVQVQNCGDGAVVGTEQCDESGANGSPTSCCTASCQFRSSGQTCRSAAGGCDLSETCTGSTGSCPTDVLHASGDVCRSSSGVCDVAEACDGVGAACPSNAFAPSTQLCRSSAGSCDVDDYCDGATAPCADAKQPSTHVCRSGAGSCDVDDHCDGATVTCADAKQPSTHVCRSSAGSCDVVETCDGSGNACPADAFAPSTQWRPCRSGSPRRTFRWRAARGARRP
jgi:hypothetical protein